MSTFSYSRLSKTHKGGFTLIELIVVIAIVGLLASVGVASLGQSREKAKVAKVQGEFGALAQALEMFRQDHKMLPSSGIDGQGLAVSQLVADYLTPYIRATPVMPSSLLASPNVYYHLNPIDGQEYDCGPVTGREEYILYFMGTAVANASGQFPQVYERGGGVAAAFSAGRCIIVTQK
ncbi:MAG TPA: prepilin-type N-terminal cleavage/methylation domain-containing protein [Candidatus Paceibacterota bacterium]